MKKSVFIALVGLVALAGTGWLYVHRVLGRERAALVIQQTRADRWQRQLTELESQRADATRTAADLARELQLETARTSLDTDPTSQIQTRPWLAQVKRLREFFERQPDQKIPELQLLTDLDWLELARTIPGDADERRARAMVREFAIGRFFRLLRVALRDYTIRSGGVPLNDLAQLQPLFRPAIDPGILARYEIGLASQIGRSKPTASIAERAPVDLNYDVRRTITTDGQGGSGGPWALEPFRRATNDAYAAYYAANKTLSQNSSDYLPFVTDPFGRAIFEAMAAYEKDHGGRNASSVRPAELLPYVTAPEIRTRIESMARALELSRSR